VPFRSWEDMRRRWPTTEAAVQRNEPAARRNRQPARKNTPEQQGTAARAAERRQRRYPVPDDPLPPLERVVITHQGAVIFTDVTGEIVEDDIGQRFYPDVSAVGATLVWATWRKPGHDERVNAWPERRPADTRDLARGWWQPTIEELRVERRKAASAERALQTRRGKTEG
jgi:hypothetical protein